MQDANSQLYLHSADGEWLDYWCRTYFGIPRKNFESDTEYINRTVAEIIKLKQNNKALEIALKQAFAALDCTVVDADLINNPTVLYDGTHLYTGNDTYAYRYGSTPGCFYITMDLPSEDGRTLTQITGLLTETAKRWKK